MKKALPTLLLVIVFAESLRAHPEGLLPLAGSLLTICHLLPAVIWVGMLVYTLQAARAWRRRWLTRWCPG